MSKNHLAEIAFDRVRVEIKLCRLSIADTVARDFFFSSITAFDFDFDFVVATLTVTIVEHNDELDLNYFGKNTMI